MGYKAQLKERIEPRQRLTLGNKVKEEHHLETYGGLKEDVGMENYSKKVYQQSRGGRKCTDVPLWPSSRVELIVGECDTYKEERDVLEGEMRKMDECDVDKFGTLDSSEITIAILGDRWWPQMAKQDGDKIIKRLLCNLWKKRNEHPNVGGVSIRTRDGASSRKGCVVNGQMAKASNK